MHVKTGDMSPGHKHSDESIFNQPFLLQHLEHMYAKKLTQRPQTYLRHHKEITALKKESIRHQSVEVRNRIENSLL
jgi:hypothetical protein